MRRSGLANRDLTDKADPLWELSSFSEAAKAAALSAQLSPDPPFSQPRWGSTAPTLEQCCWGDLHAPQ